MGFETAVALGAPVAAAAGQKYADLVGGAFGLNPAGGGGTLDIEKTFLKTPKFVTQNNNMLDKALQQALSEIGGSTSTATQQQVLSKQEANTQLQNALNSANQSALNQAQVGLTSSQDLQAPYRNIGYESTDALAQSLGLESPSTQRIEEQISTINPEKYTPEELEKNIGHYQQRIRDVTGLGSSLDLSNPLKMGWEFGTGLEGKDLALSWGNKKGKQLFDLYNQLRETFAKQQGLKELTTKLEGAKSAAPTSPEEAGKSSLNDFQNTAAYKNLFGSNKQEDPGERFLNSSLYKTLFGSVSQEGMTNPVARFQAGPDFQYNMDEALRQVNIGSAAKGLLEAGATQRDLLKTAQGLQNNEYNKWLDRQTASQTDYMNAQNATYNNFQNNLSSLTNLGSQNTGNQNFVNTNNLLAQLFNQGHLQTGAGFSANTMAAGQNISSLEANKGTNVASALLNTAASKANQIFQGNSLYAQLAANVMASNAQTASSQNAAQGANQAGNIFTNAGLGGNVPGSYYGQVQGLGGPSGFIPR